MIALPDIKTGHPHYTFVENLLHTAFPENERRDDDMQRWNSDNEERFHCLVALDGKNPVGVLTYWHFDTFIYIEHFAIEETLRGKGYGKETLRTFFDTISPMPTVLEVEHPTDETGRRRIRFYEQCGLQLWKCDYCQPPYRTGDEWFPMYLMVSPTLSFEKDYLHIRETIYHKVYGIDDKR
jgi:GNAT superfamily N-acetyltransferase